MSTVIEMSAIFGQKFTELLSIHDLTVLRVGPHGMQCPVSCLIVQTIKLDHSRTRRRGLVAQCSGQRPVPVVWVCLYKCVKLVRTMTSASLCQTIAPAVVPVSSARWTAIVSAA